MQLMQLLTAEAVAIRHNDAASPLDKTGALHALATLLAHGTAMEPEQVERVLVEREQLQSTGIGEGVAIPHGALSQLDAQHATLLIVPEGVDFAATEAR